LILAGNYDQAIAEGMPAIGGPSDQSFLITHILNAKSHLRDAEVDPFAFIPPAVESNSFVIIAKIDYLRAHNERRSWWKLAREGLELYPDNKFMRLYAADADIDEGAALYQANPRLALPTDLRAAILKATAEARRTFEEALRSENSLALFANAVSCNLITGYRLLKDFVSAREILGLCNTHGISDDDLAQQAMLVALETHDTVTAASLLEKAEPSRDTTFGKLQVYYSEGSWASLAGLASDPILPTLSLDDRAYLEACIFLAKYKLKVVEDPKAETRRLQEKYSDEPIVSIVLYEVAKNERDESWAADLFRVALALKSRLNPASRAMLSRIAENQNDANAIIEILDGFIDTSRPSDELETLARGFANAPPQARSIAFIRSLPDAILEQSLFSRVAGAIYFNAGDLKTAEQVFRRAVSSDPEKLSAHLGLMDTLIRLDRNDDVREHLKSLSPDSLDGVPIHKMRFSQLLASFGFFELALQIAYKTALLHQNEPEIIQAYIGMTLFNEALGGVRREDTGIQVDDWVELIRDGSTVRQTFIIENPEAFTSSENLSSKALLAQQLIGCQVGADVTIIPSLGTEQVWRVSAHKHKYAALLEKLMILAATRFSDAIGFHQFEIKEDDLTPILEQTKSLTEQSDEIFNLYETKGVPIAVISALVGRTTPEAAAEIVRRGWVVRSSIGNEPERKVAFKLIRAFRQKGIVLDTIIAWTVYDLGLIDALKSMFEKVAIAQSSLDELARWRSRFDHRGDEPLRTLGYLNGEYFRTEIPAPQIRATFEAIDKGIQALRQKLEILPAIAPSQTGDLTGALLRVSDERLFDPAYIAKSESLLLVSDDIRYRQLVSELFGTESTWLQPVLMAAKDEKLLELRQYGEALIALSAAKHGYLAVDRDVLLNIAEHDHTPDMDRLVAVTHFIGAENADFLSSYDVAWGFLSFVWGKPPLLLSEMRFVPALPPLRQAKAAGVMLGRLMELFERTIGIEAGFDKLRIAAGRLANGRWTLPLSSYVRDWLIGHFIFARDGKKKIEHKRRSK
jgi:hypothetical protein